MKKIVLTFMAIFILNTLSFAASDDLNLDTPIVTTSPKIKIESMFIDYDSIPVQLTVQYQIGIRSGGVWTTINRDKLTISGSELVTFNTYLRNNIATKSLKTILMTAILQTQFPGTVEP